jgi:hypothetical protein
MRSSVCRGGLATVVAIIALLSCQSATVHAHPFLVGRWTAVDPKEAEIVYEFYPADYVTDQVWRGTFYMYIAGTQITCGRYELRIETRTEGTIGLRDGVGITTCVGNIDIAKREMWYKGVTFHKAPLRP